METVSNKVFLERFSSPSNGVPVGLARTAAAVLCASAVWATTACATAAPPTAAPTAANGAARARTSSADPSADPSAAGARGCGWWPRRTSSPIAAQLGGDRVDVSSIITNPEHGSARLRGDPGRCARHRHVPVVHPERDRLRQLLGPETRRAANPSAAPGRCSRSARCWAWRTAPTRTSGTRASRCAQGHRGDHRGVHEGGPRRRRPGLGAQRDNFRSTALARYRRARRGEIKAKYAGTPIGASESIALPLAARSACG